jgi:hypothetical protein
LDSPFLRVLGAGGEEWAIAKLDDFEKKQNEDDDEDERDSAASVVAESWSHAITTEAEHKDQNEQKDKHYLFLRAAKIRHMKM